MGNNPSSDNTGGSTQTQTQQHQQRQAPQRGSSQRDGVRHFLRNNGALGLSKSELEARCQPSGLYPSCNWDYKQIRRLIGDGKLAAREKGKEVANKDTDTECPICFLHYTAINTTKCCQACICTECYLQVRNPKESSTPCPFCNQKLTVKIAQVSYETIQKRNSEEQKVAEAQMRAKGASSELPSEQQQQSTESKQEQAPSGPGSSLPSLSTPPQNTAFGASLEQNERVALMRKRSASGSSGELEGSSDKNNNSSGLETLAMTPEERQALEAEMKAQHQHPLAQRIQQEEAERRFRNERDYMNSPQYQQRQEQQQQRLRELHARRLLMGRSAPGPRATRDWNRIVQAFESGTAGNSVNSLDDLVVLEAAIMLSSMEGGGSGGGGAAGAAAAAAASGISSSDADGAAASGGDETENDFAARQARAGFPLARARVPGGDRQELLSSQSRSARARPWMMAALMSEEEQIAMAIAASLQDAPPENNNNAENNNNTGDRGETGNNEANETDNNNDTAAEGASSAVESDSVAVGIPPAEEAPQQPQQRISQEVGNVVIGVIEGEEHPPQQQQGEATTAVTPNENETAEVASAAATSGTDTDTETPAAAAASVTNVDDDDEEPILAQTGVVVTTADTDTATTTAAASAEESS